MYHINMFIYKGGYTGSYTGRLYIDIATFTYRLLQKLKIIYIIFIFNYNTSINTISKFNFFLYIDLLCCFILLNQ